MGQSRILQKKFPLQIKAVNLSSEKKEKIYLPKGKLSNCWFCLFELLYLQQTILLKIKAMKLPYEGKRNFRV